MANTLPRSFHAMGGPLPHLLKKSCCAKIFLDNSEADTETITE